MIAPPVGRQEIIKTFGDVRAYIADDGIVSAAEESQFLVSLPVIYPMVYAYDHSKTIKTIMCHKLMVEPITMALRSILDAKLTTKAIYYGGCYQFRSKRTSGNLSTHCWGIAIDLNPETNQMGTKGDMDMGVVEIFEGLGWTWGGRWKVKDAMHFQYCSGY